VESPDGSEGTANGKPGSIPVQPTGNEPREGVAMAEALTIVGAPDSPADALRPDGEPGILLHKFVKADTWRGGLTSDVTGENLPRAGSPWIYEKEILVSPGDRRAGPTSAQIMAAIQDRGYIVLAIADDA
jgi:hypothetical protein